MAAQAGRSLLMKVGNGGSPEAFTTIGGMRSTTITLNDEIVDTIKATLGASSEVTQFAQDFVSRKESEMGFVNNSKKSKKGNKKR